MSEQTSEQTSEQAHEQGTEGAVAAPKRTALYNIHKQLGAHFTDFGGWDMPLKYGSELAEHHAVRQAAGIFDLSHMGEIRVTGAQAPAFLDYALLTTYSTLEVGRAKYGVIVNADAGIVDDLITYRLADDEFLVVPNASNADTVFAELVQRAQGFDITLTNESADIALIAVQGPNSEDILLETQADADGESTAETVAAQRTIRDLKYYAWTRVEILGIDVLLARTGYTGEDGFELYVDNAHAVLLWNFLSNLGEDHGLVPAGLAARDSLRLEAGMPLYGHEMTLETTPVDAGLGGMVRGALKNKGAFFAREALEAAAGQRPERTLVGLTSDQRRAAREGSLVLGAGSTNVSGAIDVGVVTSGQPSPTLGRPIALAYVNTDHAEAGTHLAVDVRGKALEFRVVALPFYRRAH